MTKDGLIDLEIIVADLVKQRQKLGGFDANAEAILTLAQCLLAAVSHLVEKEEAAVEVTHIIRGRK